MMKNQNNIITTTILLALGLLALSQMVHAVSPAPDGGYPGGNTAEGQNALFGLTTGGYNTAVGYLSLRSNTTGEFNTAVGAGALLASTETGNTATGAGALLGDTVGYNNTATGAFALFNDTDGRDNTANGSGVLLNNTHGNANTASGLGALASNTTGSSNAATGLSALASNTTGTNNTALGSLAGNALTTGDNNIDIGYNVVGAAGESNTIRIGNTDITDTFIRGMSGATSSGGAAVFVNGNGKLGTMTSSERFKDEIRPMDKASEVILALRPVSFRYKKEIDPQGIPQFGLVAEEVERVNPDLVIRDAAGKPQTVRYEQVNAMLLNEFLKEHRTVQDLKSTVAKQERTIAEEGKKFQEMISRQQKEIKYLTTTVTQQSEQVKKVSAQLELSKAIPRTVLNDQ
jgi:hypothetical protein